MKNEVSIATKMDKIAMINNETLKLKTIGFDIQNEINSMNEEIRKGEKIMEQVYINLKDLGECYLKDYLDKEFNRDLISVKDLLGTIEDLIDEKEGLEEQIENIEKINNQDEPDYDYYEEWKLSQN